MIKLLIFLPILVTKSQLISITTCSDLNCKSNCNTWIATSNKCTDTTPYSITTYTTYTVFSDSNCITIKPNTYSSLINLDGNCNQLYTYGNLSPSGSYKAINLSLIIGSIVGSIIVIIIIIICCACYFRCCCKKNIEHLPQNTAIIIDTNNLHPPISYGYPVVDYSKSYNLQPSAPPAYYPVQPSAPPAYYPVQPSAPLANYSNNVI
jgi:hypothetical protein